MANIVKLNGVRQNVIKLQLFPFSLRDVAATWFDSLLVGSVNTWEELVETFMNRFFPPALATEEVPYAWDRSDNLDGHFLPCHELYLQEYN